MIIKLEPESFFIFDLDDTLFQEIDFLKSAYRKIADDFLAVTRKDVYEEMLRKYKNNEDVFGWLISCYEDKVSELTLNHLLKVYREHVPQIRLAKEVGQFLTTLKESKMPLGLITDGRSITQRNKLKALGIEHYFDDVIISEEFGTSKPHPDNYLYFEKKYPGKRFYYIGDNTSKDFIVPLQLGWTCICIKNNGQNIHAQQPIHLLDPNIILTNFNEFQLS
jgi:putative hydrolase of the HAD superfamily